MADTDKTIKELPLTTKASDDDDIIIEDSSPTTYRIKASDLKSYITEEVQEQVTGALASIQSNTNLITQLNTALTANWQTASLTSEFSIYNSNSSNTPMYCKMGSVVYIRGIVTPSSTIAGAADRIVIFTLPSGYRPSMDSIFICQGSGAYRWSLCINTSGEVAFARYSADGNYADAANGTWLPFSVSIVVD